MFWSAQGLYADTAKRNNLKAINLDGALEPEPEQPHVACYSHAQPSAVHPYFLGSAADAQQTLSLTTKIDRLSRRHGGGEYNCIETENGFAR